MKLAVSSMISQIDEYCKNQLNIPILDLMEKSGRAVSNVIKKRLSEKSKVIILCGRGNNGGDGYACASQLMDKYDVTVIDVFCAGQNSEEGKYFLEKYKSLGGKVISYDPDGSTVELVKKQNCIVDAIFGTGFHGEMPENMKKLAIAIRETVCNLKVAIDVPLGIDADNGSVSEYGIKVDVTVELSYIKPGIISYPARSYVGEIVYDDLGIPQTKISSDFDFRYHMIDSAWVNRNLPKRELNTNKGTFGKCLLITGSRKYNGAAFLSLEAALRGGVGYVSYAGEEELCGQLSLKYPEAIYKRKADNSVLTNEEIESIVAMSKEADATLIGSGSDNTEGLLRLVCALVESEGGCLILDADAINAISTMGHDGIKMLKSAKRQIVITPHPLEFARLCGMDVSLVQLHRLEAAEKFAKENKLILVLKGSGTIITDGDSVYINVNGSSALSKAGSGDVLAGLVSAMIAQKKTTVLKACALSVYYHAAAADSLAKEFSTYGVTPSDLPKEIAREISKTQKKQSDR